MQAAVPAEQFQRLEERWTHRRPRHGHPDGSERLAGFEFETVHQGGLQRPFDLRGVPLRDRLECGQGSAQHRRGVRAQLLGRRLLVEHERRVVEELEQIPGVAEHHDAGLHQRRRLGELDVVQTSVPKQQYYVVSPLGRRLITFGMGKVSLSFVGVNGTEERRGFDETLKNHDGSTIGQWLRFRGLPDWATYFEELEQPLERRTECASA